MWYFESGAKIPPCRVDISSWQMWYMVVLACVRSLTADLLGIAPTPSQYLILSTLHCIVFTGGSDCLVLFVHHGTRSGSLRTNHRVAVTIKLGMPEWIQRTTLVVGEWHFFMAGC